MKVLRVLTGPHAGARVALADGHWTITNSVDSSRFPVVGTICLEDWTNDALVLDVENDVCTLHAAGTDSLVWPDFEPRRYGDIVLCLGTEGFAWPDDLVLLAKLVAPEKAPESPKTPAAAEVRQQARHATKGRVAVAVLCVMGLFAFFIASPSKSAKSKTASNLTVKPQLIKGANRPLPGNDAELLDTARSALNGQGVLVTLQSPGHLVVSGNARQPALVQEIAGRLAQDLAPALKSIEVEVQPAASRQRISARLETGATAYAVKPDGTKIFTP